MKTDCRQRLFDRRLAISVLDKYIAADLIKTLLSVWSIIVVIIVSREFIRVLDKAIEGRVAHETLLSLLGLKTIIFSVSLLPAALFMAVLMVLGRMYRDQEIAAIASAGGGAMTLYKAVFLVVLPLTLISAGLSLYLSPWAEATIIRIMHQDEESSDLRGIAAGKFSEYSQGDLVFYVEKIDHDKTMRQIFMQSREQNQLAIVNAQSARLKNTPDGTYLIFAQGERVQGQPGHQDFTIEKFAEYGVRVDERNTVPLLNRQSIDTAVLWRSDQSADSAELQKRIAIPIGILLLAFIGVPLAPQSPRGGVYGNILIGFLIYFSYGNLLRLSQVWVANNVIPNWLGGIGVNAFLILIGLLLLAKSDGRYRLRIIFKDKFAQ